MKRIILSLALLTIVAVGAQAQGAGLSQGEAVKQTTANPTTTRKRCANCGITMGNITYPWQHESWCPYYRSSGGSSSSRSSSRSYGTYTAASAASTALGSLLSGLISSGFNRRNERKAAQQYTYDPKAEARKLALETKKKDFNDKRKNSILESKKYWKYGDYEIRANGHLMDRKCISCKGYSKDNWWNENSISIINTRTRKEIMPKLTEAIHKQCKAGKVPLGTRYMKTGVRGPSDALLYFFDSNQQESSPLLDGMLFIDHMWEYDKTNVTHRKENAATAYSGLCKIVDDTLQWVLKIPAPNTREELYSFSSAQHEYNGEDFDYIPNSTCFVKECENHEVLYAPLKGITLDSLRYVNSDKEFIFVRLKKDSLYYKVYDMELNPMYTEFPHIEPRHWDEFGAYFLIGNEQGYGMMDKKGNVVIPQIYKSNKEADKAWGIYKNLAYTLWYKQEAAKYIDKKGEFEKTEHFEARMNDAKMQEEYLREVMADAPQRYLEEKVWEKGELKLTLGEYNADEECFPITVDIAPWNSILLPVPMAETKAFKKEFASIKSAAAKTAQLGIRYDAPSVEAITFTTSDGKTYTYGEK